MRSIFGWDLPPGCGKLPGEEEYPCEVCGKMCDDCICPECPVCGNVGDPFCYREYGMVMNQEQTDSKSEAEAIILEADQAAEESYQDYLAYKGYKCSQ